jgi:hypothetical protein
MMVVARALASHARLLNTSAMMCSVREQRTLEKRGETTIYTIPGGFRW